MADVARSHSLAGRSDRSRHISEHLRIPRQSRSSCRTPRPEDIRYAMDLIMQPPRTVRAGQTLPNSIIVRLRALNIEPEDAVTDSSNLLAVVALVPGSNRAGLSDISALNTSLTGRRLDSVHHFADDEADGSVGTMDFADPQGVGYMSFSDLVIRQPGSYRIRIALIRITNTTSSEQSPTAANGTAVQIIDSSRFSVYGDTSTPMANSVAGSSYIPAIL